VGRADAAIGRQAERQHGLVMHAQAIEAGLTQAGIHHRLASGRWVAAASRVYRVTGATATWEARILAAVLSAGREPWPHTARRPPCGSSTARVEVVPS
jgi:hypothetical protein